MQYIDMIGAGVLAIPNFRVRSDVNSLIDVYFLVTINIYWGDWSSLAADPPSPRRPRSAARIRHLAREGQRLDYDWSCMPSRRFAAR